MANQNKIEMLLQSHQIISMVLKNILLITLLFSFDEFKDLIDKIKNLGINIKYGKNFEPFMQFLSIHISLMFTTHMHTPPPPKRKKTYCNSDKFSERLNGRTSFRLARCKRNISI